MSVWYPGTSAQDPTTGASVTDVDVQIFASDDADFATPLVVQGKNELDTTTLRVSGYVLPGFWGPDEGIVRAKSGTWWTYIEATSGLRDAAQAARDAAEDALAQVQDLANAPAILPDGGSTGYVLTRGTEERTGVWAPAGTGGGVAATWDTLEGKPSTFPPSGHTHTSGDITDASSAGRDVLRASSYDAIRSLIKAAPDSVVSFPGFGTSSSKAAQGNHTHAASSISFTSTGSISATDVQTAIEQAASMGGGTGSADANAYFVRDYASGAWPVRGRTDGVCRWRGPASAGAPPNGGSYAKAGVDERGVTTS